MLDYLKYLVSKTYHIKDKIAFYPSVISLFGIIAAYLMFYLENQGISKYLLEYIPQIVVNNTETARSLLTTFIGGLVSIMVFSFSMVMILLSQASSNFSPRLLPGLISNRNHQTVLGMYIATIIYCIFILVSIKADSNKYQLPGFSVLIAIILMLGSLGAFIYFIHSMSQSIQINNIMDRIFDTSRKRLICITKNDSNCNQDFPSTKKFKIYTANKCGYVTNISLSDISKFAEKNNCKIAIEIVKGAFVLEGQPLFSSEKVLNEKEILKILKYFDYTNNELVSNNYVLAFKQLTEITVKSMSPGINDPGTALNAIDYLSQLFYLRLLKSDTSYIEIQDTAWVKIKTVNFNELLFQVMASIRTYSKNDITVVQKLITMLRILKSKTENESHKSALTDELEKIKTDIRTSITNEKDLEYLIQLIDNEN